MHCAQCWRDCCCAPRWPQAPAAPQPGIPIVADQRSYAVPGQTGAVQTSLAHDLTAALARATGLPLRMELGLFPQLRQQVEAGRGDIMGPMFPAPWLPAHFIASEPVGEGVLRPYALTEQAQRLDAPFLPGVRWVVVRGLLAENWLQRNHPSAVRVQAADFDEAVKLLVSRQADVYLGFELVARRDIHLLRLEGDLIEGGAVARFPQAFMVHQRNPQLLQALNAGIRQIRNSGELDAIRKQWEPAPVVTVNEHRLQRAAAWGYAISLVVALSALIAVGLLWQRAQRLARERGKLLGDMQWAQAVEAQTFDANPTPMSISRASDLSLVRVNDAYVRTFGFSRGELLGMRGPARQWANPGEREALIAQALRDGSSGPRVVQVSHAQGRTIWMRVAYQRLQVAGADYVLATVADVTEIETQRREYEVMLAKAPVGILVYEGDRIVLANDEIERLLGWTPGTAIGRRAADVWRDDAEREWAKNFYRDRLRTDDLVPYEHEIGGAERRFMRAAWQCAFRIMTTKRYAPCGLAQMPAPKRR